MLTKRVGAPQEIAQAYVYLMKNDFATGTVLSVDGGAALAWAPWGATGSGRSRPMVSLGSGTGCPFRQPFRALFDCRVGKLKGRLRVAQHPGGERDQ